MKRKQFIKGEKQRSNMSKIVLAFMIGIFLISLASAEVEVQPLDMWTLFVHYVFGGFWIAVVALALVMFVIMGLLGRISIFSVSMYLVMFLLAMTLGYGYTTLNILITFSMLIAIWFSGNSYIRNNG